MYEIVIKNRILKNIQNMPTPIQRKMANLVEDLRDKGPLRKDWPNYSKLGKNQYHCHLSRSWVACWYHARNSVIIEVFIMQAVVKTPRIDLQIKGQISPKLIAVLEEEFGSDLRLEEEQDDKTVNTFETDWYRQIKADMGPGDNLRVYRENRGWTQAQLGDRLDGMPRQHVSNMERGIRPISKKTARKLAQIFAVSPGKFI